MHAAPYAPHLDERIAIVVYRIMLVLLLVGTAHLSLPGSGQTAPIIFTDRAAFDAYVGSYTLLTLDDKPPVVTVTGGSLNYWTYNDLVRFDLDGNLYGNQAFGPSGSVTPGNANLTWYARPLVPVTAFGFDITRTDPGALIGMRFDNNPYSGFAIRVDNLNFLGLVSSEAFTPVLTSGGCPDVQCRITFDNIAVKPVPEPSAILLLAVGMASLLGWHARRSNPNHA